MLDWSVTMAITEELTYPGLDKMTAIFLKTFCQYIFLNKYTCILIKISLNFVPKGHINNIPALFQIMAWCQSGDKPLSEFTDTFMHHSAPMT